MKKIIVTILISSLIFCSVIINAEVPVIQSLDTTRLDEKVYVDPDLFLLEKHLPLLKATLEKNKDDEINEILEEIICTIEQNGHVYSEDIADILGKILINGTEW